MRAITVIPGQRGSVGLTDMPEPPGEDGPVLVQTQAIGICGTDLEIIDGDYGSAPSGEDRLIIGHESLGRVVRSAPGTGFGTGDLVVGIVRRRDPDPCPAPNPLPGSAWITRPRDSCPMIRRSSPGGAAPYSPLMISRSVPQTPIACVWTRTGPSSPGGSGMSVSATEPGLPGMTVMARIPPL